MVADARKSPSTGELLDRVDSFISRFVVLDEDARVLLAAWVLHGYAFGVCEYTPYVLLTSATPRCGKSKLLKVLRAVVRNPLMSASITNATLHRAVEPGNEPTMLLDELDKRRNMDPDMRAVINAGYERDVPKLLVGDDKKLEAHPVFCPKALAGIGGLDSTIEERGIHVQMNRKLASDVVERFRKRTVAPLADELRADLEAWAASALDRLATTDPEMPDDLDDRGCDVFEPLFAIADDAGDVWAGRVRAAALSNRSAGLTSRLDPVTELLHDLRAQWQHRTTGFVPTAVILRDLRADEMLRWATFGRGQSGLTGHKLADMLRPLGVESVVGVGDRNSGPQYGRQCRGYRREQLQDAFARHLDPLEEDEPVPDLSSQSATEVFLANAVGVDPFGVEPEDESPPSPPPRPASPKSRSGRRSTSKAA